MLDHLGEKEAAQNIVDGIEHATAQGNLTKDLKGNATTSEVAERIVNFIQS